METHNFREMRAVLLQLHCTMPLQCDESGVIEVPGNNLHIDAAGP